MPANNLHGLIILSIAHVIENQLKTISFESAIRVAAVPARITIPVSGNLGMGGDSPGGVTIDEVFFLDRNSAT